MGRSKKGCVKRMLVNKMTTDTGAGEAWYEALKRAWASSRDVESQERSGAWQPLPCGGGGYGEGLGALLAQALGAPALADLGIGAWGESRQVWHPQPRPCAGLAGIRPRARWLEWAPGCPYRPLQPPGCTASATPCRPGPKEWVSKLYVTSKWYTEPEIEVAVARGHLKERISEVARPGAGQVPCPRCHRQVGCPRARGCLPLL